MVSDNNAPKVEIERGQKWDPVKLQWVKDEIPTSTVKVANTLATASDSTLLSSFTGSGTANLRVTRLRVSFNAEDVEYAVVDCNGTVDIIHAGTAVRYGNTPTVVLQGNPSAPVYVLAGTAQIYTGIGSLSGSFAASIEGVQ